MSKNCSKHYLKCNFKRKLSAFAALLTFISISALSPTAYGDVTTSTPNDVAGRTGNMDVTSKHQNDLNVDLKGGIHGDVGQVDWWRFDVAQNGHVNFGFSGLAQTIINRVLGGKPSDIMGQITSSCIEKGCTSYNTTSKVILINPAGVMFGPGSSVDLNSFTISTFDFKNSKNLKDFEGDTEGLAKYKEDVLNKLSGYPDTNGVENKYYGDITFDAADYGRFKEAGTFDKTREGATLTEEDYKAGKTGIEFNGSKLNINKSFAAVADQIKYKDSVLKTAENYNYRPESSKQSYSNARFVTADGVTFRYLGNGYINSHQVKKDERNVQRTMVFDNSTQRSGETATKPDITTGHLEIINNSQADGSKITMRETIVRGTKLVNHEDGSIYIESNHDVEIANSRIESVNTIATSGDESKSTEDLTGGRITVNAGGNLTIADSLLKSAGTSKTQANSAQELAALDDAKRQNLLDDIQNSGKITLNGGKTNTQGTVNITDTKVLAKGDVDITAAGDVKIEATERNKTLIQSENELNNESKNINIKSGGDIFVNKSDIVAQNNVTLEALDSNGNYGNHHIVLNGHKNTSNNGIDTDSNSLEGDTLIIAKDGKLSLHSGSTIINNASLAYNDLSFYKETSDDDFNHINNVTISRDSTFTNFNSGNDIDINTNGSITFSNNATVKTADIDLKFERVEAENPNSAIRDDGSASAVNYTKTITSKTAHDIKARSTKGNIFARKSKIAAQNDISFTTEYNSRLQEANNVNIDSNSTITAGNDLTLTSKGGSVNVKGGSELKSGNDTNINAQNDVNITNESSLTAQGDININAKNNIVYNNSSSVSKGATTLKAGKIIDVIKSKIHAGDTAAEADKEKLAMQAAEQISITESDILSTGDVDILAVDEAGNFTGDILVNFNKTENGGFTKNPNVELGNTTIVAQGGTLTMQGKHTHIANGSFGYKDLSFYNKNQNDAEHTNNLLIQGSSTFSQLAEDGTVSGDINIETNGSINLYSADLKTSDNYKENITPKEAANIKITSTNDNVNAMLTNLKAENDVTLTTLADNKNISFQGTTIEAGNSATLEAKGGSVLMSDFPLVNKASGVNAKDINVVQKNDIVFGEKAGQNGVTISQSTSFTADNDIKFESTQGNIKGEKETLPTILYGDRLSFLAKLKNIFTSKGSLKSVNVDYVAQEGNEFSAQNDIQFVNSTFSAPSNTVKTENGDVILNNHKIISATGDGSSDSLDALTNTTITAKGRVTTKDITGNLDKTNAEKTHKFLRDVDVDENKNYDTENDTVLDVGNTKLVVNTKVDAQEGNNNKNGSIELKVKNAHNKEAGLELTAENTNYDNQIEEGRGPEISLDAEDKKLSISKLISDKLSIKKDNKLYAAKTTLTPEQLKGFSDEQKQDPRGYIEVRDKGGFNLDPSSGYPGNSGDEAQRDNYKSEGGVDYKEHIDFTQSETRTETDESGTEFSVNDYTDRTHVVGFEDQEEDSSDFMLRYTKEYQAKTECEPIPDIGRDNVDELEGFRDIEGNASLVEQLKIPREVKEVSKESRVVDSTVDQSSNIMAAAAKIDIQEDEDKKKDSEE